MPSTIRRPLCGHVSVGRVTVGPATTEKGSGSRQLADPGDPGPSSTEWINL